MLKKFVIAVLAVLYLGVSSGIAMEIHYCMGKQSGVDFFGDSDSNCGKCGMKEKKGCCSDEQKFYKLSDSHKNIPAELFAWLAAPALAPAGIPLDLVRFSNTPAENGYSNHSPPPASSTSVRIMYCIFRL